MIILIAVLVLVFSGLCAYLDVKFNSIKWELNNLRGRTKVHVPLVDPDPYHYTKAVDMHEVVEKLVLQAGVKYKPPGATSGTIVWGGNS